MYYSNDVVSQPKDVVLLFDFFMMRLKNQKMRFFASLNLNLGVNYLESNNTYKAMECFR